LPLVENSFKHGTSNMLEQPWINLKIEVEKNQMRMKLINGKVKETEKNYQDCGIGIKNVQKRLSLLYADKHELNIINEEEVFIVNLKVDLEQQEQKVITLSQEFIHV